MNQEATSKLEVSESYDGHGGHALHLVGEVDLCTVPMLYTRIREVLDAAPSRLTIELSDVSFIDSSGVGALIETAGAVPDFVLVNPSPAVRRLIELCGLSAMLPMSTESVKQLSVTS